MLPYEYCLLIITVRIQVNLGHYMRTLVLTLGKLRMCGLCALFFRRSQRPEQQEGNGQQQPCRLVKYYCHGYGIIVFVSGNICTCGHRTTTFYKIFIITTIKHATESITLNVVSLISMLM